MTVINLVLNKLSKDITIVIQKWKRMFNFACTHETTSVWPPLWHYFDIEVACIPCKKVKLCMRKGFI